MSTFLERTAPQWMQGKLIDKIGAAFVSAGAGGRGGGELALITLHAALAEHGVVTIPMSNRTEGFAHGGCHWGPLAWSNPRSGKAGPTQQHLASARAHGQRVAECAARWLRGLPGGPDLPD